MLTNLAGAAKPEMSCISKAIKIGVLDGWNQSEEDAVIHQVHKLATYVGHKVWEAGYAPAGKPELMTDFEVFNNRYQNFAVSCDMVLRPTENQKVWPMISYAAEWMEEQARLRAQAERERDCAIDALGIVSASFAYKLGKFLTMKVW